MATQKRKRYRYTVPDALVPRITDTSLTVRQLIHMLIQLFTDRPARLGMNSWVTTYRGITIEARWCDYTGPTPECNTVGCLAGWGAFLLRPTTGIDPIKLAARAQEAMTWVLGFRADPFDTFRTVDGLFSPTKRRAYGETQAMPPEGTRAHARVIIRRLRKYMALHPEILDRQIDMARVRRFLTGGVEYTFNVLSSTSLEPVTKHYAFKGEDE